MIIQEVRKAPSIAEGLKRQDISPSQFYAWDRQLNVGINAALRSCKPVKPSHTKELERENRLLKEMVLNLSHQSAS
jgi:transposase-like protein